MVSRSCGSPGLSQASGRCWGTWTQAAPSQQLVQVDTAELGCAASLVFGLSCQESLHYTISWFLQLPRGQEKAKCFLRVFIMVYAIICGSWLSREQGEPALNFNTWQKPCSEVVQTLGESRSNWLLLWANSVSVTWKGLAQTPRNKGADYFDI